MRIVPIEAAIVKEHKKPRRENLFSKIEYRS